MTFRFIPQYNKMDCGPACLSMISLFHGKYLSIQYFRDLCFLSKDGVSLLNIQHAAQGIGMEGISVKLTVEELIERSNSLPCILYWDQNHFIILISVRISRKGNIFKIADPAKGILYVKEKTFKEHWCKSESSGIALFLSPQEKFFRLEAEPKPKKNNFQELGRLIAKTKSKFFLLLLILTLSSGANLLFPVLAKRMMDDGILTNNLNFVSLILIAQLCLFLGTSVIDFFRNLISINIGNSLNLDIVTRFFTKIVRLPMRFFDTRLKGDFNQRLNDQERIEIFLSSQGIVTLFSLLTFVGLFFLLGSYSLIILVIYIVLSFLSILWSLYWIKRRKMLDYDLFHYRSQVQESIYEILNGISEIKINNMDTLKISQWKEIQLKIFKVSLQFLTLNQKQISGFDLINQIKNVVSTFFGAVLVINNKITLGEFIGISYVIGQMNSPLSQIVPFMRGFQDAKLSLDRINEIHENADEDKSYIHTGEKISDGDFIIKDVSFQYEGPKSPFVLQNINLEIPRNKVTAIVGASGSGKTTLLKLLVKFYLPNSGGIFLGDVNLRDVSAKSLRENIGVVMQNGFIFGDTIEKNIVGADENIDMEKLEKALYISNCSDIVNRFALGLKTVIGSSGIDLSGGQKQRILIARAIYKDPKIFLFDEATSALDTHNEKIIDSRLKEYYNNKTVLIIAHRLSTVKNADQIVVLDNGKIVEQGDHNSLVKAESYYFNLIKNQLELSN